MYVCSGNPSANCLVCFARVAAGRSWRGSTRWHKLQRRRSEERGECDLRHPSQLKSPSLARCWDAPTSRALGVLRPAIAVPTSSCEAGGASGSPAKKSPCEDLLGPQISVMTVGHSQTNPPNDSPRSTRPAGRCRGSRSAFSLSMPACLFAPARGCAGPPQLRRHRIVASFLMGDRGGQGPRSGSKPAGATRRCSRQATTRRGDSREGNACRQARRRVRPSPRKFKFKCSSKAGNQRSCNARTLRVLHR